MLLVLEAEGENMELNFDAFAFEEDDSYDGDDDGGDDEW